jgi:hypothetical protein
MKKIFQKLAFFSNSFLVAVIIGIALPILFFNIFGLGLDDSITARDVLPNFDNPLVLIGLFGLMFTLIPIFILSFILYIPVWFASKLLDIELRYIQNLNLTDEMFIAIMCIIQVASWFIVVHKYREAKKRRQESIKP